MGYSKECYRAVRAAFDKKKDEAEHAASLRQARLYRQMPELEQLDNALAKTAMSVMEEIRRGSADIEARIAAVRAENEKLQQARAALLMGAGYSENETEPKYECALCRDEGSVRGVMCDCFKRALALESMKRSGLGALLKTQSFDSFSLDYYRGEERVEAERNLRACKKYAAEFDLATSPNLTFIGGTGLGKTHLSTAIAREVIERGYEVVYETAQNIMSDFEEDKFSYGRKDEKKSDRYMECDLLIMDDLGTEAQTQMTLSFLYNIINTRLNAGKKTIISTNLEKGELHKRYGDRIASRLFGEYIPLMFRGTDVRMQKLQG